MARQLDILALEPFHGGGRRAMLDAISRCSRHRWQILKLPARRLERRLAVAATWFAEHLSRNDVGHVDLLFVSEAMNLADLFRQRPELARVPSVVYFHENQLPPADGEPRADTPIDLVNLNSAAAATEIWFNSVFNLRTFLSRAAAMVGRHKELQAGNPLPALNAKAHLVPPPIDLTALHDLQRSKAPAAAGPFAPHGDPRSILVDTRGADHDVLCEVLRELDRRRETVRVTTIGAVKGLPPSLRPNVLRERDDFAHVRALLDCGLLVNARMDAAGDDLVVRALAAGRTTIVPRYGVYGEILPKALHPTCLHDGSPESIVDQILAAWELARPPGVQREIDEIVANFDAIRACRVIDKRLQDLAGPASTVPPTAPTLKPTAGPAFAGA